MPFYKVGARARRLRTTVLAYSKFLCTAIVDKIQLSYFGNSFILHPKLDIVTPLKRFFFCSQLLLPSSVRNAFPSFFIQELFKWSSIWDLLRLLVSFIMCKLCKVSNRREDFQCSFRAIRMSRNASVCRWEKCNQECYWLQRLLLVQASKPHIHLKGIHRCVGYSEFTFMSHLVMLHWLAP